MKLKELKNKKILILGFGREGKSTFNFLKKQGLVKQITVADPKKNQDYIKNIAQYEVIIKSPGIPFKSLPKKIPGRITSQTEIFLENCPGKIIGVTGTKGKSTTASLVYHILKTAGKKVFLVGNIGKPALMFLTKADAKSIFVYELSSFQLTNIKKSPQISILLNVYPEHLDYYRSFKEYAAAKANITKYQSKSDYLIYNSENQIVKKIARNSKAKKIPIKGKYYQLDTLAARRAGEIVKVPEIKINKALKTFKFLPHRLEYVGRYKEIEFYNDSLSTIPESAIEALDFLGNNVETLIAGGFDRGLDFKKLGKRLAKSKIKTLILFPDTGKKIQRAIPKSSNIVRYFLTKNMAEAVKFAYANTDKGKICLLSPASPSFGIFKDYADRGDSFKKFVKRYKNANIKI
jgi:UDP-N-acetylmuramoylalanine--D-glutamate ligase